MAVSGREKMKIKDNTKDILIYSVFFILFILGYKTPYCLDEWQVGVTMELMKRGFSGYNGTVSGWYCLYKIRGGKNTCNILMYIF